MEPEIGRLTRWLWPLTMFESVDDSGGGGGDAGAQGAGGEDQGAQSPTGGEQDEGGDGGQAAIDSPWRLEDVPEQFRAEAERLDRHWKSHFTRKMGELQPRLVDEDVAGLIARLDDPEDGAAALDELAARFDFEPAGETSGEPGEVQDKYSHLDPVLAERLREQDAVEARRSDAEKAANRDGQVKILREHVEAGMKPLQDALPEGQSLTPEVIALYTHHALGNPLPGGLPDVDGAVAAVQKIEADAVARFKSTLTGQPPPPATEGGTGVPQHDHSTPAGRRKHAEQVAERHYVRT